MVGRRKGTVEVMTMTTNIRKVKSDKQNIKIKGKEKLYKQGKE